jgi:5-methylcytosine-specific restriction enzyme subunit McrC
MTLTHEQNSKVFALEEYGTLDVPGIRPDIASAINESGFISVVRKLSGDEFTLTAGSKIGFISAGGVQINVLPRFPIYNIFYFLGLFDDLKLQKDLVDIHSSNDLLTLLFRVFLDQVHQATFKGLLHGYRSKEDVIPVLRGRIDFAKQIKSHFGNPYPFSVNFDEFTEDIPENQLIKRALEIALRFGVQNSSLRDFARRQLFLFHDVSDINGMTPWNPTRLNRHYWDALKLAELIISGKGFQGNQGDISIQGFSIDMYQVFEQFVARQLAARVNGANDEIGIQNRIYFDLERSYAEYPDIIWYRRGAPYQVIDTKYKDPGDGQDSLNDLRQVKSYASTLKLTTGHIIYAVSAAPRKIHSSEGGVTIVTHSLDLSLDPNEIGKQIDSLVLEISTKN